MPQTDLTASHAGGVNDNNRYGLCSAFPVLFHVWVTSGERYWVSLPERRRKELLSFSFVWVGSGHLPRYELLPCGLSFRE